MPRWAFATSPKNWHRYNGTDKVKEKALGALGMEKALTLVM